MTSENGNDNSTHISGSSVVNTQFAQGSKDFKGVINDISDDQREKLDQLTNKLLEHLKEEETLEGADKNEVGDAVNQVREESKKEKANKLTIKGMLSGISMVMEKVKNTSSDTKAIYDDWHQHIVDLFNLGA